MAPLTASRGSAITSILAFVSRDIGDGFARAERCGRLGVVQENDRAAHALDADLEGDARAERRLLKNERDELAAQRGGVAPGTGLHVGRELKEFTRVRGAPFRSREEIIRQRNRGN